MKALTLLEKLPRTTCSANWRGYKAYWKVEDSRLFLVRVVTDACSGSTKELPVDAIAPGKSAPLLASWYSGTLIVAVGQRVGIEGLSTDYDRYVVLKVREGVIVVRTDDQPNARRPAD